MTRMEAETIADALREYIDVMAFVAAGEMQDKRTLTVQRMAFEKVRDAFVKASRHG